MEMDFLQRFQQSQQHQQQLPPPSSSSSSLLRPPNTAATTSSANFTHEDFPALGASVLPANASGGGSSAGNQLNPNHQNGSGGKQGAGLAGIATSGSQMGTPRLTIGGFHPPSNQQKRMCTMWSVFDSWSSQCPLSCRFRIAFVSIL